MGLIKTVTNVLALIVFGVVVPNAVAQNHYFVSSSSGDDNHDGFSVDAAWASLERVNSAVLKPGDSVQFKSGDTFFGQLVIDESGSVEKPLSFTSFGPGEPPVIDGATRNNGDNVSAISIIDQDHIEISHLTIRNFRKQERQMQKKCSSILAALIGSPIIPKVALLIMVMVLGALLLSRLGRRWLATSGS